jgi:hypothetical protein
VIGDGYAIATLQNGHPSAKDLDVELLQQELKYDVFGSITQMVLSSNICQLLLTY